MITNNSHRNNLNNKPIASSLVSASELRKKSEGKLRLLNLEGFSTEWNTTSSSKELCKTLISSNIIRSEKQRVINNQYADSQSVNLEQDS